MRLKEFCAWATVTSAVAGACFVSLASSAHADGSVVTVTQIDDTGATDDTAALQALIDALPNGSTLVFPLHGEYRIEGTLHVANKQGLTIEGNGSLFFATTTGDRTRSQWSFEGGSNIVVRDVNVKGANPNAGLADDAYVSSLEAQHAFNIYSTDGIELSHVSATDVYGDFVYIGAQEGALARNVFVHDSMFDRNGRQGISITGGDGVRIIHNTIGDVRRSTFDLEPNGSSWGALNVDIEDNTIGRGRLNLLSSAGSGPVSNVVFANNLINRGANIWVGSKQVRGPFTITGNVATLSWGSAAGRALLAFTNVDGLTVTDNKLPVDPGRGDYGVNALDACNVHVSGNDFPGAAADLNYQPASTCTETAGSVPTSGGPSPQPSVQEVWPLTTAMPVPSTPSTGTRLSVSTGTVPTSQPDAQVSLGDPDTAPTTGSASTSTPQLSSDQTKASSKQSKSSEPSTTKHHAGATAPKPPAASPSDAGLWTVDLAALPTSSSQVLQTHNLLGAGAVLLLFALFVLRLFRRKPAPPPRTVRRHPGLVPTGSYAMEVLPRRSGR